MYIKLSENDILTLLLGPYCTAATDFAPFCEFRNEQNSNNQPVQFISNSISASTNHAHNIRSSKQKLPNKCSIKNIPENPNRARVYNTNIHKTNAKQINALQSDAHTRTSYKLIRIKKKEIPKMRQTDRETERKNQCHSEMCQTQSVHWNIFNVQFIHMQSVHCTRTGMLKKHKMCGLYSDSWFGLVCKHEHTWAICFEWFQWNKTLHAMRFEL